MSKYYGFASGLVELSIDTQRLPQTQEEYYLDVLEELSSKDRELLEWLRLETANRALLQLCEGGHLEPSDLDQDEEEAAEQDAEVATALEHETTLPVALLRKLARMARRGRPVRRVEELPNYMVRFINELFAAPREEGDAIDPADEDKTPRPMLSLEDRLSELYYGAASCSRNAFLGAWFRFNQTLRNVLAVHTCRRLGWDVSLYIVGEGNIEERLRTSRARDFDLADEVPLIGQMVQIAEEKDITRRERMIDNLRWQWLEEETFAMTFDIESLLTYYIRLGIIERWLSLDEETGQKVFREIVYGLKRESNASLEEFKKNTSKR